MSLLNCEIYQRGRVSRVADTELILPIAHLILAPGSIAGVGRVRRNQISKQVIMSHSATTGRVADNIRHRIIRLQTYFLYSPHYTN